ncbi:hypothetical protein OTU49_014920 [Cherax quadricarinatus]|uniref:F-box domain-containing protein n=1 Tax=Cherax quadricarinatus TaxID=27406 RepID=A0AAW0YFU2_CHEQU
MKVKVKYSKTHKFILTLEDDTLGSLKNEIRKFVENTYHQSVREPLTVSLNGSDPLVGSEDVSLQSLGVVNCDMLTVLIPSVATQAKTSSHEQKLPQKEVAVSTSASRSEKMESSNKDTSEQKLAERQIDPKLDNERELLSESKDGQPTANLEKIFNECSPTSPSQALNLLIHLIMLESGFHMENNSEPPAGWNEMVATFRYSNSSLPDFKCTLVLVTMGDVKQVLASFPQQESEINVRLVIGDYAKDTKSSPIKANNLVRVAQLTRTLRDHLLHPLQVAAHEALGVPAPWHLAGLPHELLLMIASMLDYCQVLRLRATCQRLKYVMDDNKLWENLFKRDFSNLYSDTNYRNLVDWKTEYKKAVNRRKEWKRLEDEGLEYVIPGVFPSSPFMPGHPHPRGPNPYPVPPHPQPNPFYDPDSPYFSGEIPQMPGIIPDIPDPFFPLGPIGPRPGNPFQPPFMPTRPRAPRGPRFDFF